MEHTPIPWTYDEVWALIKGPNGEEIAALHAADCGIRGTRAPRHTALANAEKIVQAVNHHEELVKALSLTIRTINDTLRHGLTSGQLDALGEVTEVSRAILQRIEKGE